MMKAAQEPVQGEVTGSIGVSSRGIGSIDLPAPLLRARAVANSFTARSLPIGIAPDSEYQLGKFTLDGERLYIFSNGFAETHIDDEEFGIRDWAACSLRPPAAHLRSASRKSYHTTRQTLRFPAMT